MMKNIALLSLLLETKGFVPTNEIKKIVANPSASISLLRKRGLIIESEKGRGYKLNSITQGIELLNRMKEVERNFKAKIQREKSLGFWATLKLLFSR